MGSFHAWPQYQFVLDLFKLALSYILGAVHRLNIEVPLTNRRADTKEAELSFVHISGPQGSRQQLSGFLKFPVNDGEAYFIQRPSNRSLVTSRGVITRTGSLCGIPYKCNPDVSDDKPVESRRRSPV